MSTRKFAYIASSCVSVGSRKESSNYVDGQYSVVTCESRTMQTDANGSNLSSTQLYHHLGGSYIDSLCIGLLIIILSILNRIGTILKTNDRFVGLMCAEGFIRQRYPHDVQKGQQNTDASIDPG